MSKSLLPNLYAHRGFHNLKIKENTLESLENAYKNQFKAIEFDIWLAENDKLIISHDQPKNSNEFFYPLLENFLKYQNHFNYWLDFKNIDLNNIDKILTLVANALLQQNIDRNKVIFAPYITDYSLALKILNKFKNFFLQECNFAFICDETSNIDELHHYFSVEKIDFLSIYHKLITPNFLQKIAPEKILAWTVNDENILNDLINLGVKNFATDRILPQISRN